MIEETSIPLFVLCTSSLITAFAYYNIKYRKFINEQAAYPNTKKQERGDQTFE